MHARILLEDGTWLLGRGHGARTQALGEFVFNTAMTGYEEVLSDPSYRGQVVVFTASHVGNTGITRADLESEGMQAEAIICKEIHSRPDNPRSRIALDEYLREQGRVGISDVDTRFLASHLRSRGCLKGIVCTEDSPRATLEARLKAHLATPAPHPWGHAKRIQKTRQGTSRFRVAVIDFGIKESILRALERAGCECICFPPDFHPAEIEAIRPDGLFFSNGPGDPADLCRMLPIASHIKLLAGRIPTLGICLGHQLLGLAFGGRVSKLRFGHHATNHPVKVVRGTRDVGKVIITSQNHNFCVEPSSIARDFEITHTHGNDGTLAGMRHRQLPILSVQFHPEAGPGPSDASPVFEEFFTLMEAHHAKAL